MLSRRQFGLIQIARGLSTEETIVRSGIPAQSFIVLMESDGKDGRDPSKLISEVTFIRLARTLGLEPGMAGLCAKSVVEWRLNQKNRRSWDAAVHQLRKDLFSDSFEMAVVNRVAPFYSYKRMRQMVFLHDLDTNVKLVITGVDSKAIRFLKHIFAIESAKSVMMDAQEFDLTAKLIENGVYRSNQFHIVLGGRKVRYTWPDVHAAAKEFGFTTDDLIDLMVTQIRQRHQPSAPQAVSGEERPALRVAAG